MTLLGEPTVAELIAARMRVRATCTNPACGHSRVIDPAHVCFHSSGSLPRLGLVLRCRVCGRDGMATRVATANEGQTL